jgi:hypothetical protein
MRRGRLEAGLMLFAIFVRRFNPASSKFGRRRFLGHVFAGPPRPRLPFGPSMKDDAIRQGRKEFAAWARSCDRIEAEPDAGEKRWYGQPDRWSPGGVGLL